MTDSALYTNVGGAKNLLQSMQLIANNLANINTNAFHGDYENFVAKNLSDDKLNTRVLTERSGIYTDLKPGPVNYTGRDLDVAIDGPGFIAVQTKEGSVAYTRAGNLNITPDGLLVTSKGDIVLGQGGVITVPPTSRLTIDKTGIVSAQVEGQPGETLAEVGRIMLVDAPAKQITKGINGLYHSVDNTSFPASQDVRLIPESLEGSNVDAIKCLTDLIEYSRQYDMHTKHIRSVEENANKGNQLLNVQA